MARTKLKNLLSTRPLYLSVGILNIVIFHYALWRLWFFLYDSSGRQELSSPLAALAINTGLIVFFSWPHSFLLRTSVKKKILSFVPQGLYGSIYSLHASLAILLMDSYWADLGGFFYQVSGAWKVLFQVAYAGSWMMMAWSMIATGPFRQSGIEQWWKGLKGRPLKHELLQRGPYALCRHPIYASFLGMIWFSPRMSYDHLFLSLTWTLYIFIGASLKERRLLKNTSYRAYAQRVPAFPLIPKSIDHFLTQYLWRQT